VLVCPAPASKLSSYTVPDKTYACVAGRLSCMCVVQATLSNPLNEKNLTSLEDLYNVGHHMLPQPCALHTSSHGHLPPM